MKPSDSRASVGDEHVTVHQLKNIDIPPTKSQNNPVMKPIYSYALLAAFAAVGAASAQVTATTTPVGYVTLGDTTPGQPSVKPETDVFFSLPLQRPTEFAGTISSVGTVTTSVDLTLSSAPTVTSGVPYLLKIGKGVTKEGQILLVNSVAGAVVNVSALPGDTLSGIASTNPVSLFKAWTPASLFSGTNAVPAGTRIYGSTGTVAGIDLSLDVIYEFDGGDWVDGFTFDPVNNNVLYQGETFVLRNVGLTPITSVVLNGEVPVTKSRVSLSMIASGDGQDNFVSYISGGDEMIGSSGLSAAVAAGDRVYGFDNNAAGLDKSPSTIVEWDGGNWLDGFTFDAVDTTFSLQAGKGYFIRLGSATPVGDVVWSDQPTYVPTL